MKVLEGVYCGTGKKMAIVASRFNEIITNKLVKYHVVKKE